MPPVNLNGDFADAEIPRDLLVEPALHYERHHLALARGQGLVARDDPRHLRALLSFREVPLERLADGRQQRLVSERLGEELDPPRLHRAPAARNVSSAAPPPDLNP